MKKLIAAAIFLLTMVAHAMAETRLKLVEVMTNPKRTETLRELIKGFEKENPGIKVEIISLPLNQSFEKYIAMVSTGDIPDVMEMPGEWLSFFAQDGLLASLEPYLAKWHFKFGLADHAWSLSRSVDNTAYVLPYGFYLRALFYNKKLLAEAGVTQPPETLDELKEAAEKISKIPGKYGYCFRGGDGGLNAWIMYGAAMAGSNAFFEPDGTSTLTSPGWMKGLQWTADLYKKQLAPKESIHWNFNDALSGFYTGQCAFLDQDPDALMIIGEHMKSDEFGVIPMPKGPSGLAFPTLEFAGWSIMSTSDHPDLAWKLIETLNNPEGNLIWSKRIGILPLHKSAQYDAFYANEQYKGWFLELNDKKVIPTILPSHLDGIAFFSSSLAPKIINQVLSDKMTVDEMAKQMGNYLTIAQKKYLAQQN